MLGVNRRGDKIKCTRSLLTSLICTHKDEPPFYTHGAINFRIDYKLPVIEYAAGSLMFFE